MSVKNKIPLNTEDPDYYQSQIDEFSIEKDKLLGMLEENDKKTLARSKEIKHLSDKIKKIRANLGKKVITKLKKAFDVYVKYTDVIENVRIQLDKHSEYVNKKSSKDENSDITRDREKALRYHNSFKKVILDENQIQNAYKIYGNVFEVLKKIDVLEAGFNDINRKYSTQKKESEKIQDPLKEIFFNLIPEIMTKVKLDPLLGAFDTLIRDFNLGGSIGLDTYIIQFEKIKAKAVHVKVIRDSINEVITGIRDELFKSNIPNPKELNKKLDNCQRINNDSKFILGGVKQDCIIEHKLLQKPIQINFQTGGSVRQSHQYYSPNSQQIKQQPIEEGESLMNILEINKTLTNNIQISVEDLQNINNNLSNVSHKNLYIVKNIIINILKAKIPFAILMKAFDCNNMSLATLFSNSHEKKKYKELDSEFEKIIGSELHTSCSRSDAINKQLLSIISDILFKLSSRNFNNLNNGKNTNMIGGADSNYANVKANLLNSDILTQLKIYIRTNISQKQIKTQEHAELLKIKIIIEDILKTPILPEKKTELTDFVALVNNLLDRNGLDRIFLGKVSSAPQGPSGPQAPQAPSGPAAPQAPSLQSQTAVSAASFALLSNPSGAVQIIDYSRINLVPVILLKSFISNINTLRGITQSGVAIPVGSVFQQQILQGVQPMTQQNLLFGNPNVLPNVLSAIPPSESGLHLKEAIIDGNIMQITESIKSIANDTFPKLDKMIDGAIKEIDELNKKIKKLSVKLLELDSVQSKMVEISLSISLPNIDKVSMFIVKDPKPPTGKPPTLEEIEKSEIHKLTLSAIKQNFSLSHPELGQDYIKKLQADPSLLVSSEYKHLGAVGIPQPVQFQSSQGAQGFQGFPGLGQSGLQGFPGLGQSGFQGIPGLGQLGVQNVQTGWGPADPLARQLYIQNKAELDRVFQNGDVEELNTFLKTRDRNLILRDYNIAVEILSKPLGMQWLESEAGLKWLSDIKKTDQGDKFYMKYSTLLSSSPNPTSQKLASDLRIGLHKYETDKNRAAGVQDTLMPNYYQTLAQAQLVKQAQAGKL